MIIVDMIIDIIASIFSPGKRRNKNHKQTKEDWMYRYIFLDLDKTIFDFDAAENEAIREVFKSEDLTITDDLFAEYKQINQATWRKLETGELTKKEVITKRFELFFERHHIKVDGVLKDRLFRSVLESNTQLIDGAHSLLEYLQNKDYIVCSASNGVYELSLIHI